MGFKVKREYIIVELDNNEFAVKFRVKFLFFFYDTQYLSWYRLGDCLSRPGYFARVPTLERAKRLIRDTIEVYIADRIPNEIREIK
jgi:hypothetical protein